LQVELSSTDATELQALLVDSGVLGDLSEQISSSGVGLGGTLSFNGTLKGKLSSPELDGRVQLGSLLVNGNDLGTLTATITMNPAELRVANGRLQERDGGGIQFSLWLRGPATTTLPWTQSSIGQMLRCCWLPFH